MSESLDRPDSVIYDRPGNVIYVSNVVGDPAAMDGNGCVVQISREGQLIEPAWVVALDAPKGTALYEDRRYVADLDKLVVIDVTTGREVERYDVSGEVYLNDVTVDEEQTVYVTGSRYSTLYRLRGSGFDELSEPA